MPPVQDKIVFVSRLTKLPEDNNKEKYTTHSGYLGPGRIPSAAVRCNIQPASAEATVLVDGVYGKTFKLFTSNSGVVEGMRVTISGTTENYIVRGREKHSNGFLPEHFELIITKDER